MLGTRRKIGGLVLAALVAVMGFSTGCKKEELSEAKLALKVNKYIKKVMNDAYLWYDQMPNLKPGDYADPKEFFKGLLYKDDKWSYITDDATTLTNSLSGVEKGFGYELAFYREGSSDYVFAVVEYVNSNSPASRAGIVRGDIFVKLNNQRITVLNYIDLVYAESVVLTFATLEGKNVVESTKEVALEAERLNVDPVQMSKVIDCNGKKVGYVHYTSYVAEYNTSLEALFGEWKAAGVEEVVLDLRYNGGGSSNASTYLCSCLAPKKYVDAEAVLVYNQWNKRYDSYWRTNRITAQYERRFDKSVPYNLNLDRLFVLTTNHSASASELTIVGLDDYMNVIQIGKNTYGKYTSMVLFQPEDEDISNWALLPIVAKYTSSNGFSDFKDGLKPDYEVDDALLPAVALGDESEPLLAKALEIIGGSSGVAPRRVPERVKMDVSELYIERITDNDIIDIKE